MNKVAPEQGGRRGACEHFTFVIGQKIKLDVQRVRGASPR
jgi:hypothetical protein